MGWLAVEGGRIVYDQWRFRAINNGDQAAAVVGTYYTIIPATSDIKVAYVMVRQTNQPGGINLRVRVTVDGETITGDQNPAAQNTWYYAYLTENADTISFDTNRIMFAADTEFPGQVMTVEYQSVNAGANLEGRGRVWTL